MNKILQEIVGQLGLDDNRKIIVAENVKDLTFKENQEKMKEQVLLKPIPVAQKNLK
jgi:hypothetical protein